jgi:hypothetical protein
MDQGSNFKYSKLSWSLVTVFVLIGGIITGLNISRSVPFNEQSLTPISTPPPASVLSISKVAKTASPSSESTQSGYPK